MKLLDCFLKNLSLLFFITIVFTESTNIFAQNLRQDSLALVDLYNSTNGDNWKNNNNWLKGPVSTWYGIAVSGDRVTKLNLYDNNLVGILPPELGNLSNLQELNLKWNQLSGSIPAELSNLSNLQILYLVDNKLNGFIPPKLGNLFNLRILNLGANQLSGPIPPELGNLSNLQELVFYDNQLSESIPPELGKLSNMKMLNLGRNQLSESIPPELGNLSNLQFLYLYNNQFSDSIPPELSNLSNLKVLILSKNKLSGSIPPELSNLSNLKNLQLSSNQLSGPIPSELGNLSDLQELNLYWNQLSSKIPPELGNLSNLYELYLNNNQLSGTIPPELSNLSNLKVLSLYKNELSGSIPPELSNLSNLEYLNLSNNQLSGTIPSALESLLNLQKLDIHSNQLIDLPDLSAITRLYKMQIQHNKFTFEDIEPNIGVAVDFIYSPQDSVGIERDTTVSQRASLTLSVYVGGEHNQYQWKKDDWIIPDANETIYTISSVTFSDSGSYTCEITNTVATNLTLHSRPITIFVISLPNFTIAVTPDSQAVFPGDSAKFTLSFEPQGGFDAQVNLIISDLSAGLDLKRSYPPFSLPKTMDITFSTSVDITPGIYKPYLTATSGDIIRQRAVTINVLSSPDFSMIVEPDSQAVIAGESVDFIASFEPLDNFNSQINLSISGLPAGMEAAHPYSSQTFSIPVNFNITFTASSEIEAADYYPVLSAFGGGVSHQTTIAIAVLPQAQPSIYGVFPNPFTPNNDGYNDYVEFRFPETLQGNGRILIFNISGKKIRELQDSYIWYGNDDSEQPQKPGAYIYIVKSSGKVIAKGVINLAL